MCPWGQRYINGEGGLLASARLVCHVLLIEGADGLVLVDTGFGSDDVRNPRQISVPFTAMMRPRLEVGETAVSQVRARGFDPADVRHIVLTHLDVDHAGGLPDFPQAKVHVWARGKAHWAHGPDAGELVRCPISRTDGCCIAAMRSSTATRSARPRAARRRCARSRRWCKRTGSSDIRTRNACGSLPADIPARCS